MVGAHHEPHEMWNHDADEGDRAGERDVHRRVAEHEAVAVDGGGRALLRGHELARQQAAGVRRRRSTAGGTVLVAALVDPRQGVSLGQRRGRPDSFVSAVDALGADDLGDAADALRDAMDECQGGRLDPVPVALSDALELVRDAARGLVSAFPKDTNDDAAATQAKG